MSSQTASVLTWGCTHNQKDSQLIEQQLIVGGYQIGDRENYNKSDVVIINTCTVKTPTENKITFVLDDLQKTKKKVVVAGCLSQAEPEMIKEKYPNFIILGVNASDKILGVLGVEDPLSRLIPLESMSEKRGIKDNKLDWIEKPLLDSTQWNEKLNIIQINEGCLNYCTFCATKKARGHLRSYQKESIISAIRKTPTPEVWLTSQDTACWGFDIDDDLSNLLNEIDKINRKFIVRVGMGNPNNLIKIVDKVIESFKSEKIYKFLHLPVQVGNNRILENMRRGYTVEEYELIVDKFRKEFPEMTLATDIICGYPTETEDEFEQTIQTILKTRPSITNISRYWERTGTVAAEMEQLPFSVRKKRSGRLTKICKELQMEDNQKWIGWEGEIYLAEMGAKGGIQARNFAYKPIIVEGDERDLGKFIKARIVEAKGTYFLGEIIE